MEWEKANEFDREVQVYYHTSYLRNWGESRRTRSGMLASLLTLLAKMAQHKTLFEGVMPASAVEVHEMLYRLAVQSFERWLPMAEAAVKVQVKMLRAREETGRGGRAEAAGTRQTKIARLLQRLRML